MNASQIRDWMVACIADQWPLMGKGSLGVKLTGVRHDQVTQVDD
ncbi:hypothetical protein [Bremerella sp. P1]|nr:hypothetical protein [Bremerella sp. P1]WDI40441.1 hypothetical protein PSR63_18345 [Bremerella sp. P1]